jgi:hypothetical protein
MTVWLRIAAALAGALAIGACVDDKSVPMASTPTDPTLQVMREAGMLGTWADNCAAAPARSNLFVIYYAAPNGKVRRKLNAGPTEPELDGAVDSAERPSPTTMRMKLRNDDPNWGAQNGVAYDVTVDAGPGYRRTLLSIGSDGVTYIRDGKLRDGRPVPTLKRCPS